MTTEYPAEQTDLEAADDEYRTAQLAQDIAYTARELAREELNEAQAKLDAADEELLSAIEDEMIAGRKLLTMCQDAGVSMVRTADGFVKA
jgi:tartrate dehydratase alpha subunit/fumarate hydratase class I-like protein